MNYWLILLILIAEFDQLMVTKVYNVNKLIHPFWHKKVDIIQCKIVKYYSLGFMSHWEWGRSIESCTHMLPLEDASIGTDRVWGMQNWRVEWSIANCTVMCGRPHLRKTCFSKHPRPWGHSTPLQSINERWGSKKLRWRSCIVSGH